MRRVASATLGLIAIIGLVIGSIGVWAQGTLFDTDRFVEVTGRTYADPAVQAGLVNVITDQTMGLVDPEKYILDLLPDRLAPLAPMITGGLESKLHSEVGLIVASDRAAGTVEAAARQAHLGLMRVLTTGDAVGGLSAADGEVTLNLLPLISRALVQVQRLGIMKSVDVPEFTSSGDPREQISELSRIVGRQLPDDFGQLVIYRGDRVESAQGTISTAQRVLVIAKRGTWLALVVAVAAAVGAVLVARSRLRAVVYLSLAAGVALAVVRSTVVVVIEEAPQLVANPSAQSAVTSALTNVTGGLLQLLGLMILVAGAVALAALAAQRFAKRQLAVALGCVAMVAVVALTGAGLVALVTGVAAGLLASLAFTALSGSSGWTRPVETLPQDS